MARAVPLGAPGIYEAPDVPLRALTGVRMDVCAFVGVAPRGPARVRRVDASWVSRTHRPQREVLRSIPTVVESWDEYVRAFGAFEGPGLLPYAVAAFFEQGGRRAYVVRIVHHYGDERDDQGVARGIVPGIRPEGGLAGAGLRLRARNEGSWGNGLELALIFQPAVIVPLETSTTGLVVAHDAPVPAGTLFRLALASGERLLRFAAEVDDEWRPVDHARVSRVTFETAVPAPPDTVEVVAATVTVREIQRGVGEPGADRSEAFTGVGLSPRHPRWLAKVLYEDSALLYPEHGWLDRALRLDDVTLPDLSSDPFSNGDEHDPQPVADRYADITPEDFFDPSWVLGNDDPGDGVHALVELSDLSLVAAPDLYSPEALPPVESVTDLISFAGPTFTRCVEHPAPLEQASPPDDLHGLRLDPTLPDQLQAIVGHQLELVQLADLLRSFVVLLDVPPGLTQSQIVAWRSRFRSEFAAVYHPWLEVNRAEERDVAARRLREQLTAYATAAGPASYDQADPRLRTADRRDHLIRINPSAVAAGIIARSETLFGVQHGPANALAYGVVNVVDAVSPARHDQLHPLGVNVFLRERDGVRLTAARTLAGRPEFRQLSVRRLITMLVRTLAHQTQWTVFEPNGPRLRRELRHVVIDFLRELFRANAFRGATEAEAFFVRCDEELNPPPIVDAGRLIAEVGVAPAEPLEFIVLRIDRSGDGALRVEA